MILKYPGGKDYIKKEIIQRMCGHTMYFEPFFGSGKVFFEKQKAQINILSDINPEIINFWEIVRNMPEVLVKGLSAIQYCREAFEIWRDDAVSDLNSTPNRITSAMRFFILHQMSRGGMKKDFSDSKRQRRGMDEGESAFKSNVGNIFQASMAIQNCNIIVASAIEVLNKYGDNPNALFYLDPPYYNILGLYQFEMAVGTNKEEKENNSLEQHLELLGTIRQKRAKILISGYDSDLYRKALSDWNLTLLNVKNRMGQGKTLNESVECIWRNYW